MSKKGMRKSVEFSPLEGRALKNQNLGDTHNSLLSWVSFTASFSACAD